MLTKREELSSTLYRTFLKELLCLQCQKNSKTTSRRKQLAISTKEMLREPAKASAHPTSLQCRLTFQCSRSRVLPTSWPLVASTQTSIWLHNPNLSSLLRISLVSSVDMECLQTWCHSKCNTASPLHLTTLISPTWLKLLLLSLTRNQSPRKKRKRTDQKTKNMSLNNNHQPRLLSRPCELPDGSNKDLYVFWSPLLIDWIRTSNKRDH